MFFHFDARKATQAATVLLEFDQGAMDYIRLLKLLYIADRECIQETGRPISLSQTVAMDHGPLSSDVYDLIKGNCGKDQAAWNQAIKRQGYKISLQPDAALGHGRLSKFEIDKLNEVSARYSNRPSFEIVDETHEFEEWKNKKPEKGSSQMIPFTEILDALGFDADQKNSILEDIREKSAADRLFAGVAK